MKKNETRRVVASAPTKFIRLRPVNRPVDSATINNIRKSASDVWKSHIEKAKESVTTYNGFHVAKTLDEPTQNRVRPSSKSRSNKPHPPNVFLVTRLNEIEGCFAPQEAAFYKYGDAARRNLDRFVHQHKEQLKKRGKAKPLQRPYSCLEPSYSGNVKMQTIMGQVPERSAETWSKMHNNRANDRARRVVNFLRQYRPSKMNVVYKDGVPFHLLSYNKRDTARARQPYYDFQIHPEWHMPWHKHYETVALR